MLLGVGRITRYFSNAYSTCNCIGSKRINRMIRKNPCAKDELSMLCKCKYDEIKTLRKELNWLIIKNEIGADPIEIGLFLKKNRHNSNLILNYCFTKLENMNDPLIQDKFNCDISQYNYDNYALPLIILCDNNQDYEINKIIMQLFIKNGLDINYELIYHAINCIFASRNYATEKGNVTMNFCLQDLVEDKKRLGYIENGEYIRYNTLFKNFWKDSRSPFS